VVKGTVSTDIEAALKKKLYILIPEASVVELEPLGSKIICLSAAGSKLIVKIIMCPYLELTLHYKLIIP
jgi:hypothetical protein